MTRTIQAIFDSGVFRPITPVELTQGTPVEVQVPVTEASPIDEISEETKLAWNAYVDRMDSLPDSSPRDGFSNRDHDRILYGG
jgi:predicted DNA-binding antitoxin AbrB/MazE fold protein